MKKKPIVTTQHMMTGQEDKSRCNDSAVAQQLTAANDRKASREKIFRNLFSFITISIFSSGSRLKKIRLIMLNEQNKKAWEPLVACPTL